MIDPATELLWVAAGMNDVELEAITDGYVRVLGHGSFSGCIVWVPKILPIALGYAYFVNGARSPEEAEAEVMREMHVKHAVTILHNGVVPPNLYINPAWREW